MLINVALWMLLPHPDLLRLPQLHTHFYHPLVLFLPQLQTFPLTYISQVYLAHSAG